MKIRLHSLSIQLALLAGVLTVAAQGTAFTYQGQLTTGSGPADGHYDLTYKLWNASSAGAQVGSTITKSGTVISNGLFTATLDFGSVFNGSSYWLELGVRSNGIGSYQTLIPRQPLTPTPYAISAENVNGPITASQLTGTIPSIDLNGANGSGLVGLNASQLTTGIVPSSVLPPDVAYTDVDQTFSGTNSFTGNILMLNPSSTIRFPATGGANAPMMEMFASGTQNADRMVIAHSPSYPDWGLQYQDTNDIFNFLGSGSARMTVNLSSGNVGIGIPTPEARLDVNGNTILRGNLSFTNPTSSITFPATAAANNPMIYMFASGTVNTDRMVIAHSPSYPNWGLQYQDSSDQFNFLAGGAPRMTVNLGNGNVGIGTATPVNKLSVTGNADFSGNVSASAFLASSDERIKRIEGRSDSARDLATLLGIGVTDYTYIDTVAKGAGKQKKVIAQQVEKVYPQAVSRNTDVVPDIYQNAVVKDGWVKLATNLKKGERVRLISGKTEGIYEVLEVAPGKFRTDFGADGDEVFIYGREVKDFRSVDYEAIAMLNVSATQELSRRLEKQVAELSARDGRIATLEKANQEMQHELATQKELTSHLQAEFASVQKAVARLADKSSSALALNH